MNGRRALPVFVLAAWGLAARASAFTTTASATPVAESATLAGESAFGTGWMVNAGYFFKDTLFYSGGRGGPHVNAGKLVPLPHGLALWAGAGLMTAKGSYTSTLSDGNRWETAFDLSIAYADLGIATPWTPFPVALVVYSQSATVKDELRSGAAPGRTLRTIDKGVGVGLDVHLLFEWFLSAKRGRHRGPALVLGYEGFIDLSGHALATTDAAGGRVEHKAWKPLKGESLRGGIEWEF